MSLVSKGACCCICRDLISRVQSASRDVLSLGVEAALLEASSSGAGMWGRQLVPCCCQMARPFYSRVGFSSQQLANERLQVKATVGNTYHFLPF